MEQMPLYLITRFSSLYDEETNKIMAQKYLQGKSYLKKENKRDVLEWIAFAYGFCANWHPHTRQQITCLELYRKIRNVYNLQASAKGRFIAKFLMLHYNTIITV